jgi:Uma2 family endonuclease
MTYLEKIYNVNDYLLLEEGSPYQLINGGLIMTPAPSVKHQLIVRKIVKQIEQYLENKKGILLFAPTDVYFDEQNVMQPDILYVSEERLDIVKPEGIHGAPDLIIEVLSPSSSYYDTKIKKRIYEKQGVSEYWIIDPEDYEVVGYKNTDNQFIEFYKGFESFTLINLGINISII